MFLYWSAFGLEGSFWPHVGRRMCRCAAPQLLESFLSKWGLHSLTEEQGSYADHRYSVAAYHPPVLLENTFFRVMQVCSRTPTV